MDEDKIPTIRLSQKNICRVNIGSALDIGTRKNQEDSIFGFAEGERAIGIVCDGMGGLAGGEEASRSAAVSLAEAWFERTQIDDVPAFLQQEARRADEKVAGWKNKNEQPLAAGTTIAAAVILGNDMYWLSVGDSRIYLIHGNEIRTLNRLHNYRMALDARLKRGDITPKEYAAEEHQADALISYIGMGNLSLIDVNRQAVQMESGDIVILASDGLYRCMAEDEILAAAVGYADDMQAAADALIHMASLKLTNGQDNTSVVLMSYW